MEAIISNSTLIAKKTSPRTISTIPFLALADLRHEWLLNLCLIFALAAVLAPLLLLLGLKHGTIETLRQRLVQDPVYRELKPQQSSNLNEAWFSDLAAREDVAFIVPSILRASSLVRVSGSEESRSEPMDLVPTGPGDVLILDNGGIIPQEGEVVMTTEAAESLGVTVGSKVKVRVSRRREGRSEVAVTDLKVVSVLPPRADALPRLYAPLAFVTDVEVYREGRSVPARGWPGGAATPYLSFDGVYVVSPQELNSVVTSGLIVGTGFSVLESLTLSIFSARTGLVLPEQLHVYDVRVLQEPVTVSAVQDVREKLRGYGVAVLPYGVDLALTLYAKDESYNLTVIGLSLTEQEREILDLPELPWGRFKAEKSFLDYAQILLPESSGFADGETIQVSLGGNSATADQFPLRVAGLTTGSQAVIPAELAGVIRTALKRQLVYDSKQNTLLLSRTGYSGFRLYARSIDDVVELHRLLRAQGIETIAKVQDIERIRELDRGLTRLFWLVAIVGIIGGIAALVASLYAAIERKKRDLSMLRLLGLARLTVARFPIYQSLVIAMLAALLASSSFYILSTVINTVFASDLGLGEKLCRLPLSTVLVTVATTIVAASMSSLFAAWRATLIEPGEAIRVE